MCRHCDFCFGMNKTCPNREMIKSGFRSRQRSADYLNLLAEFQFSIAHTWCRASKQPTTNTRPTGGTCPSARTRSHRPHRSTNRPRYDTSTFCTTSATRHAASTRSPSPPALGRAGATPASSRGVVTVLGTPESRTARAAVSARRQSQ